MTPSATIPVSLPPRTSPPPDPMLPRPAIVSRVIRETRDTFTVCLDVSAWPEGFVFAPGQFNMLYAFGVGEVPISISGDPQDVWTLAHTIRAVGTVTRRMWEGVRAVHPPRGRVESRKSKVETAEHSHSRLSTLDFQLSDRVVWGVRGPFGTPWPIAEARGHDVLIMAGGIGLAPLRPVIYHVLRHRQDYGRVVILYGTRTPQDVLYAKELERWRGRFDVVLQVTVDRGGERWRGHVGVVTSLLPLVRFDPLDTVALLCGPEVMMRFGIQALRQRGLSDDQMFVSMERNMKCGVGLCGHCQYGPTFICREGPVMRFDRIAPWFHVREI